ncbi:hypothetical protein ACSBR1_027345 [Camellia fascicularis]
MVRTSFLLSKVPLVMLGGFNAIRYGSKKFGGSSVWSSEKEAFNSHILQLELMDLSYGGCQFTWANKRDSGDYIATKIDRVLVNESWLDSFSASSAYFHPSSVSDHSPAVVTVSTDVVSFKKPFNFFDFWAQHDNFIPTVSEVWNQYIPGVPMFRICQKLRDLKLGLKALNKKDFSDISTRVLATSSELNSIQWKLDKDPGNPVLQTLEKNLYKQYVDLSTVEESLARQKSRIQWLGLGDSKNKFFFRYIKGNINRGKILCIERHDGLRTSKPEDIQDAFISFFSGLFGEPIDDHYNGFGRINSLVKTKLS